MTSILGLPAAHSTMLREKVLLSSRGDLHLQIPRSDTPATVISDSEWRDGGSDSGSEFEEDGADEEYYGLVRTPSEVSRSSFDEVSTPVPASNVSPMVHIRRTPSIQGPTGPHLFRMSIDSAKGFTFDHALQLSPLLPKDLAAQHPLLFQSPIHSPIEPTRQSFSNFKTAVAELNASEVEQWTSQDVANWMFTAGFDESIIKKFEEHDISGSVLLDMQIQDLKELDIASFGKRHQIWKEICALRADRSPSPAPTRIEGASRPASRASSIRADSPEPRKGTKDNIATQIEIHGSKRRRNRRKAETDDNPIMPAESVSIVAIEQLLPKPHKCSKGEKCSKWRKQQRVRNQLDQEFGITLSPAEGGSFFLAGNPGNPLSANKITNEPRRPMSNIALSVVASSDVLGPGERPVLRLQEDILQTIATRDPLESVRRFIEFQHLQAPEDVPQLPLTDIFDAEASAPVCVLSQRAPAAVSTPTQLPRLSIPRSASANPLVGASHLHVDTPVVPATRMYRLGTPASDMDLSRYRDEIYDFDQKARDVSNSVPPNMHFRQQIKYTPGLKDPASWRRHSLILPTLPEVGTLGDELDDPKEPKSRLPKLYGPTTTHSGWMQKRKAKLLRHEWATNHYRLTGTQLAMHATAKAEDKKAVETIDVNDYFVSCSTRAGNSKIGAALKALHISNGKIGGSTESPFGFQLVPVADKMARAKATKEMKSHHFAVAAKEERVDWMREVMLAKAMKQKNEGFSVTVNGQLM